jgi:hypothetical protein
VTRHHLALLLIALTCAHDVGAWVALVAIAVLSMRLALAWAEEPLRELDADLEREDRGES